MNSSLPESFTPATEQKIWNLPATIAWGVLIFTIFSLVQAITIAILLGFLVGFQDPNKIIDLLPNSVNNGNSVAVATIVAALICIPLIVGVIRLRKGSSTWEYLGFRNVKFTSVVMWVVIGLLFNFGFGIIAKNYDHAQNGQFALDIFESANPKWLLIVALVIAAPFFEEIFFRGFILKGILHSRLGATGAVIVSAILFAVVHIQYNWIGILNILGLGIVLALARLRTGSIWPAISVHAVTNGLATIGAALQ